MALSDSPAKVPPRRGPALERGLAGGGRAIGAAASGRGRQDHDPDRRDGRGEDVRADVEIGGCRAAIGGLGGGAQQRIQERLVAGEVFTAPVQTDRPVHVSPRRARWVREPTASDAARFTPGTAR